MHNLILPKQITINVKCPLRILCESNLLLNRTRIAGMKAISLPLLLDFLLKLISTKSCTGTKSGTYQRGIPGFCDLQGFF